VLSSEKKQNFLTMHCRRTRRGCTKESNLRSEEMICEILFETESAYECVAELGELGAVLFKDVSG
jgi:hypothetical protein